MKHLHTWKIKDTPNCANCQIPETIAHAVWECPVAQQTINNLTTVYNAINNTHLTLDKKSVIYGIRNKAAVNTILTVIKRALILQREEKQILSCEEIKRLIKQQCDIELFIARKKNNQQKHVKRWTEFNLID